MHCRASSAGGGTRRTEMGVWCQGCNCTHTIKTKGAGAWGRNGDVEKPMFTPSVLVTWPANPDASEEFKEWRTARSCHTFITDGRVQFLGDCTHGLAGQTLDLPDLPTHLKDE